ncbi:MULTISPECIES: universal stress protein [unclassified Brevibacterium]|uniref:universal stress protein n=1 Tax=unclassified Brevibacterium TaxID=2614124 RepID=UPI001092CB61|nr:universal stress protein [Brevibacterium sp. S22]TGD28419.1 universal stress protein [Brevibacterium sp. S22]
MTDLYSTPQSRFPAPSLQVTASPGIDSASATVVLALRPDASDEVLEQAIAAARREDAALQAVVFGTDTTTAPSTSPLAECTRLGASLAEAGLEYAVHRAGPDLAEQILGLATDLQARLIVMAAKRRSPVVKLLLGSSAQQVILEAECPVLLVK